MKGPLTRHLGFALLILLPILVFHRALFFGEAFLPADLLGHLYPWRGVHPADPTATPWNVLRFDGITEFYPWRRTAAEAYHTGRIPLWNPYAFAADGGTPLLADSQSAPLYPLNLIFWLFPPGALWYAFGLSAAVHLLIAAKGTYHFLRSIDLARTASLVGAVTFALSGPVITWLALPTFLAVSCWLPWLLLMIRRAHDGAGTRRGVTAAVGAGLVAGLSLLAGHLQVAFYVLLAASLYTITLGIRGIRQKTVQPLPWLGTLIGCGLIAVLLAAPQVLPALELSRVSHRVSGPPKMEDYTAYVANALPPQSLVTLITPDFFGHPNRDNGLFLNLSNVNGRPNNYAEWAAYAGIAPLILAIFALASPWRGSPLPHERGFFAGLLLFALLLALGTPINLPLYFLIPGYSQTGNPARCLVLYTFALACLAAFGVQAALSDTITADQKKRALLVAAVLPLLLAALGLNFASSMAAKFLAPAGVPFSALLARATPDLMMSGGGLVVALGVVALAALGKPEYRQGALAALVAHAVLDLGLWGNGYNPTVPAAQVYTETPGIQWLKANARDARIAPINRVWSMTGEAPRDSVLPPNGLSAFGLHDVGGYDSLFLGTTRERAKQANGGEDPSPPENGNMVFVKGVEAAKASAARFIVVPPGAPDLTASGLTRVYPTGDSTAADMVIYEDPAGKNFDSANQQAYQPTSFRLGLFLSLFAVLILTGIFIGRPKS